MPNILVSSTRSRHGSDFISTLTGILCKYCIQLCKEKDSERTQT
jgi:hypothetical protein